MCTAIHDNNLFGRTLDLEYSYGEKIAVVPRGLEFTFSGETIKNHPAILGVAHIKDGYPLFYDAVNEHGLAIAALNFPGNAVYFEPVDGKTNITSYELIPRILATCNSVSAAEKLLLDTIITNTPFSPDLKPSPLHWMIADKHRAITVEQTADGLNIYDNPIGVMTNNPPFTYHMHRTADFLGIDSYKCENKLCSSIPLEPYSRGSGGMGLPGDYSSSSRFVRAVFAKYHTTSDGDPIGRFFHITDTVSIPKGTVKTNEGADVCTVYTSCADLATLAYYFTTYGSRRIRCARLTEAVRDADEIITFDMSCYSDLEQIDSLV